MAVSDAHVFPGFPTPKLTQLSFQRHRLLFSHASEVRGEYTLARKFASTGYQTHDHQVMSQTRSPLSHLGGLYKNAKERKIFWEMKGKKMLEEYPAFSPFSIIFPKMIFDLSKNV